jgi:hypothetical protein
MENSYVLGQEVELYLSKPVTDDTGATVDCATAVWEVIPDGGTQVSVTAVHVGSVNSGQYQGFYTPAQGGIHYRYKFVGTNPNVAKTGRFYVSPDPFT